MKLKMIRAPTPRCPNCKAYLIERRTVLGDFVYDCYKCQSIYEEVEK